MITGAALLALWASTAGAVTPGEKCEADKLKTAGKYTFCRMKADAKAIKTSTAPDYSKCDEKYGDKWGLVEGKAGGACPVTGDEAAVQTQAIDCTDGLAATIGGNPPAGCVGDLLSCEADLAAATACGNGAIDAGEDCDFGDLDGATCLSEGFDFGSLACGAGCFYDTTQCSNGGIVDQTYAVASGAGGLEVTQAQPTTQTFTVGVTGQLVRIDIPEVKQYDCTPVEDLRIKLVATSGGAPTTTVLATVSLEPSEVPPFTGPFGEVHLDLSAYGIQVTPGDVLGIRVETDAPSSGCNYAWNGDAPGTYAGGATFIGSSTTPGVRDMSFRTLVLP